MTKFYFASGAAILCILLSACAPATIGRHRGASTTSGTSSLEAIVDAQLAAYNRRDVEGFLSYYSDDAKLFDHPNQLTESGKDQLRTRYRRSFGDKNVGDKNVRAFIVERIVFDRFVIDHKRITGRPDGTFEAVADYEIKDGKIIGVTF